MKSDELSSWLGELTLRLESVLSREGDRLFVKKPEKRQEPVLTPSPEGFDSKNVYNPAVVKEGNRIYVIYRAESKDESKEECTGRLGLAWSEDGVNFHRLDKPIMIPENDYERVGVEDPRLVKIKDTWVLTYTGYDGVTAKLCLATFKGRISDFLEAEEPWKLWVKKGPIFPKFPPFKDYTKSGAILPIPLESGKFAGKYIMLFGVPNVWFAYADDPTDPSSWKYIDEPLLTPREDFFDNSLVEGGPPLIPLKSGILAIYNSADETPGYRVYKLGAVLLDYQNPLEVLARTQEPFMVPEHEWEERGWVDHVVFLEGMVEHKGKVLLYYGGADRYIGLGTW